MKFERDGEETEVVVEGYYDDEEGLVVTAITDMFGNDFVLSADEETEARDCLYDSIFNYTGVGEKAF